MSSVDMSSYPTLAFAMNAEEAQSSQMRVVFSHHFAVWQVLSGILYPKIVLLHEKHFI